MKRVVLLLACALLLGSAALAQVPPAVASSTPEERATLQTQVMKEKLSLTDAQLPQVKTINLKTAQTLEPVLKGSDGPLVKVRSMRAAEAEREAGLKSVLTPAQMQQFQTLREEIRQEAEKRLEAKQAAGAAK